jgi:hypothetical protein
VATIHQAATKRIEALLTKDQLEQLHAPPPRPMVAMAPQDGGPGGPSNGFDGPGGPPPVGGAGPDDQGGPGGPPPMGPGGQDDGFGPPPPPL